MTEKDFIQFLRDAERGEELIAEIVSMHTANHAKVLASVDGIVLTDEQAEIIASNRRKEFVEGIQIIENGGALGLDMWRPLD